MSGNKITIIFILQSELPNNSIYFFARGQGNEFSNLTGSLHWVQIFLSLPTGTVTLIHVSFCPFVYKATFKCNSFFQKFFIRQESWKRKAFFSKQIFITILKWRNSSLQRWPVYFTCKVQHVCAGGSERIKKLIWKSEEKDKQIIICQLRVLPYSKKLWPQSWESCLRPQAESSIFKTEKNYTYFLFLLFASFFVSVIN